MLLFTAFRSHSHASAAPCRPSWLSSRILLWGWWLRGMTGTAVTLEPWPVQVQRTRTCCPSSRTLLFRSTGLIHTQSRMQPAKPVRVSGGATYSVILIPIQLFNVQLCCWTHWYWSYFKISIIFLNTVCRRPTCCIKMNAMEAPNLWKTSH